MSPPPALPSFGGCSFSSSCFSLAIFTPSKREPSSGRARFSRRRSYMIHHLVLFKVKPEVDDEKIEWMMRETRIQLLKIPEVLSVRCGKRIDESMDWPFFLAVEIE